MIEVFRMMRRLIPIVALSSLCVFSQAWKPKTHIYLADRALREIIADGCIRIFRVDHATGRQLELVGKYEADPALLAAIRSNRKVFNAGVLGPDAFPDIATGQCIIHPENSWNTGSNSWLEHLWAAAQRVGPEEKAFAAGFLFHAAGDMFGHTYINHFAGGPFTLGPNALRHIILEGYIGKRTPVIAEKEFGIDPTIREFIYQNMINGAMGSDLDERLLVVAPGNPMANLSVPRVFSRLKNYLLQALAELRMPRANYDLLSGAKRAYIEHWIADIDSGLREWPNFSEKMASLLVYNTNEAMSSAQVMDGINRTCNDYVNQHLLSMAGAPDFVGLTRGQIDAFVDRLTQPVHDAISQIKSSLRDAIFQAVFQMSFSQVVDYLNRPENYFDRIMGPTTRPNSSAATITMQEFDQTQLHRDPNGEWQLDTFAPAYNTVLMTKLILMKKSEMDRLIADLQPHKDGVDTVIDRAVGGLAGRIGLQSRSRMPEGNAMLGFNFMLDNSLEWRVHRAPNQMVLVRTGGFDQIFIHQVGEEDRPLEPTPRVAPPSGRITVSITRATAIDNVDPGPFQGQADFYARIQIDDRFLAFDTIQDRNDIRPSWFLTKHVVGQVVPIQIELWDEDGGLAGPDDQCDICPAAGRRVLNLTYNLVTRRISGDASGAAGDTITVEGAGDSDRCRISFRVEQGT